MATRPDYQKTAPENRAIFDSQARSGNSQFPLHKPPAPDLHLLEGGITSVMLGARAKAIPCGCFRQKADRWVEEDRGPGDSASWRARLRSSFRQTSIMPCSGTTCALADQPHHPAKPRSIARPRRVARSSLRRGRPKQRARAPVLPARDGSSSASRLSASLRACPFWQTPPAAEQAAPCLRGGKKH